MNGPTAKDKVTLTTCPVCEAPATRPRAVSALYYSHCPSCGVEFLNPRMSDEYTEIYYRTMYRKICPVDEADIMRQVNRARNQAAHTSDLWTGLTMLEIGCSAGYLMEQFALRGFGVTGIDPEPRTKLATYPRLEDSPPRAYDWICLSHSLEHFNHPLELIGTLQHYAHRETRYLIEVPNRATNYGAYRIHHPVAFDQSSLKALMALCGLREVRCVAYGPIAAYLLGVYEVEH